MSRRRKHVRELVDEPCPELGAGDAVCRVVELRGGNHIEVEKPDASQTLCRIPSKFSKILWVRAGSFIVAHFEDDAEASDAKVTGELMRVLYADQIKEMKKRPGVWPERFEDANAAADRLGDMSIAGDGDGDDGDGDGDGDGGEYSSDDSLPPIAVNRNRRPVQIDSGSDSSDSDE